MTRSLVQFRAMGTDVQVAVIPPDHPVGQQPIDAKHALSAVVQEMQRLEALLSRFRDDSEVTRINNNPGQWVPICQETLHVLQMAEQAFKASQGLFNPCLGQTMEAIGYGDSFDRLEKQQNDPFIPLSNPLPRTDVLPYEWSEENQTAKVYLHPGFRLDLGGIAKGWIVESCGRMLRARGYKDFVINAGGDMVCSGMNENRPWRIGVDHPFRPEAPAVTLELDSLSMATSGTYRRSWTKGSETMHHIIDPRTQLPSTSDVVSCTIVHPSLVAAEWMAKTCLLLGSQAGMKWLSEQHHNGWVLIQADGEVKHAWNS